MIHIDEGGKCSHFLVPVPLGCGKEREPGTGTLKVKSCKGSLTALGQPLNFADEEDKCGEAKTYSGITADGDFSHEIKTLAPWKKSYEQPRQHSKKQRHCFTNKVPSSQSYGFSSSHVWMRELDYKES